MKVLALTMKNPYRPVPVTMLVLSVLFLFVGFVSSASAKDISTRLEKQSAIQSGTYTMTAYGCNAADDLQAVAILEKETSPYHVSIVEPRAQYQVLSGLSADEAYRLAEDFVTCNPNAQQTELSRMTAADGSLIGYEMKPVYLPLRAGSSDGVETTYRLKGDSLLAYVDVDPLLRLNEFGGG